MRITEVEVGVNRIRLLLMVCAVVVLATVPSLASAAEPLLGFGAAYNGHTHSGVDVAGTAGAPVTAVAEGTVVFAGSVPADGGGTCIAVSIDTADGRRISMLPLGTTALRAGDVVAVGDEIGLLAESGDDSSPAPHLHVSLRNGGAYLDPSSLLALAPAEQQTTAPDAQSDTAPVTTSSVAHTTATPAVSSPPPVPAQAAAAPAVQPALAAVPAAPVAPPRHLPLADAAVPRESSLSSHIGFTHGFAGIGLGALSVAPSAVPIAVIALLGTGVVAVVSVRHKAEVRA
jgi:hypothetical protein